MLNKIFKLIFALFLLLLIVVSSLLYINNAYLIHGKWEENVTANHQAALLRAKSQVARGLSPEAVEYLKTRKVFVSLTTTPGRIKYIEDTLSTIDTRHIENIILAIPNSFGRSNEKYYIPEGLSQNYPKLKIIRRDKDLGPIMKLVPAAEYANSHQLSALIITIDDDRLYPYTMVNEFINHAAKFSGVLAGVAYKVGNKNNLSALISPDKSPWNNNKRNIIIELFEQNIYYKNFDLLKRYFIAGYGAVAYPSEVLNVPELKKYSQLSRECYRSDDLVISYSLNEEKTPIVRLANKYFSRMKSYGLEHGGNEEALNNEHHLDNYFSCLNDITQQKEEEGEI